MARPQTSPIRSATNSTEYLPHYHPGSRVSLPNGHPAFTQAALHVVITIHPTPVGSALIHSPFLSVPLVKGRLSALPVLTPGLLRHPKDLSQFGAYEDGSSFSRLVGAPSHTHTFSHHGNLVRFRHVHTHSFPSDCQAFVVALLSPCAAAMGCQI
jgi:hypothetical protein